MSNKYTAIAAVEQTQLGRLVERRETLVEEIAKVKRELRNTPVCNPEKWEKQRAAYAEALELLYQERPQLEEAMEEWKAIRARAFSPIVKQALDYRFHSSPEALLDVNTYEIKKNEDRLKSACSDPRTVLSNSLAELELALANVKNEIKEASK